MKALIINTFHKEWRSRSLIMLIVLTLIFLIIATALLDLLVTNFKIVGAGKTAFSFFLILIGVWSTFVATMIGTGIIRDDLDFNVLPQFLALPISRAQYLLARFSGTWLLLFIYFMVTYVLAALLFEWVTNDQVWHVGVLLAPLSYALKILPILLFSCLFSLYLPKLFSFVMTMLLMLVVGVMNSGLLGRTYAAALKEGGVYNMLALGVDALLPRVGVWDQMTSVLLAGEFQSLENIKLYLELPHFVATMGLWSFLLLWLFKRKEI